MKNDKQYTIKTNIQLYMRDMKAAHTYIWELGEHIVVYVPYLKTLC